MRNNQVDIPNQFAFSTLSLDWNNLKVFVFNIFRRFHSYLAIRFLHFFLHICWKTTHSTHSSNSSNFLFWDFTWPSWTGIGYLKKGWRIQQDFILLESLK